MGFSIGSLFGRNANNNAEKQRAALAAQAKNDPKKTGVLTQLVNNNPKLGAVIAENALANAPVTAPDAPVLNPVADQMQASLAGQRARRRAMQGQLMARPKLNSTLKPTKPAFNPKALIGRT